MIWELLIASLYTLLLLALGAWIMYRLLAIVEQKQEKNTTSESISMQQASSTKHILNQPESGALKSMTPLERSQEESKEVRERIEDLLK